MIVSKLIEILKTAPPTAEVQMYSDPEGNETHDLHQARVWPPPTSMQGKPRRAPRNAIVTLIPRHR